MQFNIANFSNRTLGATVEYERLTALRADTLAIEANIARSDVQTRLTTWDEKRCPNQMGIDVISFH